MGFYSKHSIYSEYTITPVDAASALVTWYEFYKDCKRHKFTLDGIRAVIRYYYPSLNKMVAEERDLSPSKMNLPTELFFDECADIVHKHYELERKEMEAKGA